MRLFCYKHAHCGGAISDAVSGMKKDSGFTLVEALVAASILVVAVSPIVYLAFSALGLAASVQNSIIGANLAQEGVEVVRGLRGDNWLVGDAFDSNLLVGECQTSSVSGLYVYEYEVTWRTDFLLFPPECYKDQGRFLYVNWRRIYNYTTTGSPAPTKTIFKRKITVQKSQFFSYWLSVTSDVSWLERGGRDRHATVQTYLFDWGNL